MKKILILFALAGLLFGCQSKQATTEETSALSESPVPSIVGAWEIVETSFSNEDTSGVFKPYKSIVIYTDHFYSVEVAWEDRPSWPEIPEGEQVSYDNLSNAYASLTSNSGRYETRGDSIYVDVIVAKSPNLMNDVKKYVNAFKLEGDQLTTTSLRPSGTKFTWKLRRIGS